MDEEFRKIIAQELGISLEQVTEESSFDSLGADSLEVMETIIKLEDAYGISLPDYFGQGEELPDHMKLKDVWEYINTERNSRLA